MSSDSAESAIYTPAYGTVKRGLEFLALYVVVGTCTELITGLFEGTPFAANLSRLTTGIAVFLWAWFLVTAYFQVRTQRRANPVEASDPASALAELRLAPKWFGVAAALAVVGTVALAVGWSAFTSLMSDPITLVDAVGRAGPAVTSGEFVAVLSSDVGRSLLFLVGLVLAPYGVDRTVVGLVREAQYRWYLTDRRPGAGDDPASDGEGGEGERTTGPSVQ